MKDREIEVTFSRFESETAVSIYLMVNGLKFGTIYSPSRYFNEKYWKISITVNRVYCRGSSDHYKDVELEESFDSEKSARIWIQENFKKVVKKYPLYFKKTERIKK